MCVPLNSRERGFCQVSQKQETGSALSSYCAVKLESYVKKIAQFPLTGAANDGSISRRFPSASQAN
jgi:hypothetical protein